MKKNTEEGLSEKTMVDHFNIIFVLFCIVEKCYYMIQFNGENSRMKNRSYKRRESMSRQLVTTDAQTCMRSNCATYIILI